MRALAHSPRDRYGRMQQLIDALVEERFASGLREGASDLAHAIREVAPKSDVEAPRTMHTDRPVTLMTRSLLRDVTPARRPSRPSRPSHPPPPAAVPPTELPSSDEFAVRPTIALATPVPAEPPADDFPAIPSSGAQTVARMVDQVALAQAAQAAQAMLAARAMGAFNPAGNAFNPAGNAFNPAGNAFNPAGNAFNPAGLRADGTPMPPFRMSYGDVRGEELASVVGGHTLSHGAGIAVESRGHRWTFIVLCMAALIGAIAAIVMQLTPSGRSDAAPERTQVAARLIEDRSRPSAVPEAAGRQGAREERELAPGAPPAEAPSAIPDPSPASPSAAPGAAPSAAPGAAPGAPDPTTPGADPAPDPKLAEAPGGAPGAGDARSTDGKAADGKATDGKATDGKATDGKATDGKTADGKTADGKTADGKTADGKTADGKTADGKTPRGKTADGKSGEGRSTGRRSVAARDTSQRKGILSVDSRPWSWVTVGVETLDTPAKFHLDPGVYTVRFYNEVNDRTEYAKVTIEPDKMSRLNKDMN
jgi:hypothetical protein